MQTINLQTMSDILLDCPGRKSVSVVTHSLHEGASWFRQVPSQARLVNIT